MKIFKYLTNIVKKEFKPNLLCCQNLYLIVYFKIKYIY